MQGALLYGTALRAQLHDARVRGLAGVPGIIIDSLEENR
jgi:hypothetical protein